ncbi:MAG TPA: 5'/3'-nucleotidase SurE [Saprospiraceae bacterium]|nr:5'/3'-nucleotidase SurE [Saprospiraceae bacterium]
MKKPLILIANDDGIFAPGIKALVEAVKGLGEVVVVAPDSPQSGMGHAITINQPLRLNPVNMFEGIESYSCTGTPADCVKLAKNVLFKDRTIDLCVSGINHGSNASINIIYSGTMSAAMEASLEGIPSVGFSLLDYSFTADFTAATLIAHKIARFVLQNRVHNLYNVNIPKLPLEEIKGIKICRQGQATWVEEFQEGTDPRGQKYYWLTGKFENKDAGKDSDLYALENGYVSVVPSDHDLTSYQVMEKLTGMEIL